MIAKLAESQLTEAIVQAAKPVKAPRKKVYTHEIANQYAREAVENLTQMFGKDFGILAEQIVEFAKSHPVAVPEKVSKSGAKKPVSAVEAEKVKKSRATKSESPVIESVADPVVEPLEVKKVKKPRAKKADKSPLVDPVVEPLVAPLVHPVVEPLEVKKVKKPRVKKVETNVKEISVTEPSTDPSIEPSQEEHTNTPKREKTPEYYYEILNQTNQEKEDYDAPESKEDVDIRMAHELIEEELSDIEYDDGDDNDDDNDVFDCMMTCRK